MSRVGRSPARALGTGALILCLLNAGCGASGPEEPPPDPTSSPPAQSPLTLSEGIDVSAHSGQVEWHTLAQAGHTFAFIKATEGIDLKDAEFDANWAAAKQAGVRRGAYHFYVTEDDPAEQARWFTSNVSLSAGDLVPVVDLELIGRGTIPSEIVEHVRTFLGEIETHYQAKPIIYTSPVFWDRHLGEGFGDYPLWVAEYGVEAPRIPVGWTDWHLWQWKGDATVAGVSNTADLSRTNSSGVDLAALVLR